jgi:hypothetical protein
VCTVRNFDIITKDRLSCILQPVAAGRAGTTGWGGGGGGGGGGLRNVLNIKEFSEKLRSKKSVKVILSSHYLKLVFGKIFGTFCFRRGRPKAALSRPLMETVSWR